MEGQSKNILAENISKLKELFPEAFTEGKVNFHASGVNPGGIAERFPLTFTGLCNRIDRITIEGGETVRFEPGGLHLMVLGIDPFEGPVPILLQFEDDTQIEVNFAKVTYN